MNPLPYQLHTNRELGLMLSGTKPLAVFADINGRLSEAMLRYFRLFDRRVETGELVKREYVEFLKPPRANGPKGVHVVLYALPTEIWRIDEMIALRGAMDTGWTAEHERAEGRLLGYEEWQTDLWIAHRFQR